MNGTSSETLLQVRVAETRLETLSLVMATDAVALQDQSRLAQVGSNDLFSQKLISLSQSSFRHSLLSDKAGQRASVREHDQKYVTPTHLSAQGIQGLLHASAFQRQSPRQKALESLAHGVVEYSLVGLLVKDMSCCLAKQIKSGGSGQNRNMASSLNICCEIIALPLALPVLAGVSGCFSEGLVPTSLQEKDAARWGAQLGLVEEP